MPSITWTAFRSICTRNHGREGQEAGKARLSWPSSPLPAFLALPAFPTLPAFPAIQAYLFLSNCHLKCARTVGHSLSMML
jgi:hypothetical protein